MTVPYSACLHSVIFKLRSDLAILDYIGTTHPGYILYDGHLSYQAFLTLGEGSKGERAV